MSSSSSSSPFGMGGRRCLVTGATDPTSIGYACARALLAAGAAHVVVMGRDQAKVEAAVAGLNGEGPLWGVCGLCGGMNVQPPLFEADADRKAHAHQTTQVYIHLPPGHAGQASGVVGDLKHPGMMAGVVEHSAQAMGGLDTLVVSGGNGGSEYLVGGELVVFIQLMEMESSSSRSVDSRRCQIDPSITPPSHVQGLDCADPNSYRMMQDVAVLSPLFLTEAAAPHLQKAPGGGTVVRRC